MATIWSKRRFQQGKADSFERKFLIIYARTNGDPITEIQMMQVN